MALRQETTMTQRVKVAHLPELDAGPCLESVAAIAAYLKDILEAHDPALLAAASYPKPTPVACSRIERRFP
jgi:hypothetical protein